MAIYEILIVEAASSRDDSYKAIFFRGWKPLPREIDVNFVWPVTPALDTQLATHY